MSEAVRHSSIVEELKKGKSIIYFTVGVSMRPLLAERRTQVEIVPLETAEQDDILLYIRENGARVLHRCIRQGGEYYYMRGDNTYGLEAIRREQAIGVVTRIYRKGKWFDVKTNKAYRIYVYLWRIIYPLRLLAWLMKKKLRNLIKS